MSEPAALWEGMRDKKIKSFDIIEDLTGNMVVDNLVFIGCSRTDVKDIIAKIEAEGAHVEKWEMWG